MEKEEKNIKEEDNRDTCFVIMPFGGYFDDYYKDIYFHAIESAGLKPKRVDDLNRPSSIIQDIWTYTKKAKLILADLTEKNPNVFYELGLAHAIAKPAILITQDKNDIPFDLQGHRVIEYDKNIHDWGLNLREKIETSIIETINSPLAAVLPAFIETKDSGGSIPISKQEKTLIEINQELRFIREEIGEKT